MGTRLTIGEIIDKKEDKSITRISTLGAMEVRIGLGKFVNPASLCIGSRFKFYDSKHDITMVNEIIERVDEDDYGAWVETTRYAYRLDEDYYKDYYKDMN